MGVRTHHIHMMPQGPDYQARLLFRDYLRSHGDEASRYAELKRQLAEVHGKHREHYTDAKAAFVNTVLAKAAGTSPSTE